MLKNSLKYVTELLTTVLLLLALSTGAFAQSGSVTLTNLGVHPSMLLTQSEIDQLKGMLNKPTTPARLQAAWDNVKNFDYSIGDHRCNDSSCSNVVSRFDIRVYTTLDVTGDGRVDWGDRFALSGPDGLRTIKSALSYALSDDIEYARAARKIIMSWTQWTVGGASGHGIADQGLAAMALAYDLIYDSGVLSASDKSTIETWMRNVVAPLGGWYPEHGGADWYGTEWGGAANMPRNYCEPHPPAGGTHPGMDNYDNGGAELNVLYGVIGYALGDLTRIQWATGVNVPGNTGTDGEWNCQNYFPPTDGRSPRNLREFIRGGIYRNSTYTLNQHTDAYFAASGNPLDVTGPRIATVLDYYGQLIPNGIVQDYLGRGAKPCPEPAAKFACPAKYNIYEGWGQNYSNATLSSMIRLAHIAAHHGDNLFTWRASNGNRLKDGTDFARKYAAHSMWPAIPTGNSLDIYPLLYSYYKDPVDKAIIDADFPPASNGGYFVWNYQYLIGAIDRSGGATPTAPSPPSNLRVTP